MKRQPTENGMNLRPPPALYRAGGSRDSVAEDLGLHPYLYEFLGKTFPVNLAFTGLKWEVTARLQWAVHEFALSTSGRATAVGSLRGVP